MGNCRHGNVQLSGDTCVREPQGSIHSSRQVRTRGIQTGIGLAGRIMTVGGARDEDRRSAGRLLYNRKVLHSVTTAETFGERMKVQSMAAYLGLDLAVCLDEAVSRRASTNSRIAKIPTPDAASQRG